MEHNQVNQIEFLMFAEGFPQLVTTDGNMRRPGF